MIKTIMGYDFNFFKEDKTVGGNTVHYVIEPKLKNIYWLDYFGNINEHKIGDMIFSFVRSEDDETRFSYEIYYFHHCTYKEIKCIEGDWAKLDILSFVNSINGLPDTSIAKLYVNIEE